MNAFDESLTSNAEHAAGRHHPPFAPTAEPQRRAPGSSIDSWLLTRLRAFLGEPPVEFAVRGRALGLWSMYMPAGMSALLGFIPLHPVVCVERLKLRDEFGML